MTPQVEPLKAALMIAYREQVDAGGRIDWRAGRRRALALLASGVPLELPPYPGPPATGRATNACRDCGVRCYGLLCAPCRDVAGRVCTAEVAPAALWRAMAAAGVKHLKDLAALAGLTKHAVWQMASNRRHRPAVVAAVAAALGTTPEALAAAEG